MNHEEYEKIINLWNEKDKTGKKAPAEQVEQAILDYIQENKTCALATGSGDYVRCTPVDYVFYADAFWILTEGGMKFKGLETNPNVSLAIFDKDGKFGNLKGLQIMGTAEIAEPFSEDYLKIAEIRKIPVKALKQLTLPMNLLKITPTEFILLDSAFKKQGFDSREILKK